jgi:hypothetical protein
MALVCYACRRKQRPKPSPPSRCDWVPCKGKAFANVPSSEGAIVWFPRSLLQFGRPRKTRLRLD